MSNTHTSNTNTNSAEGAEQDNDMMQTHNDTNTNDQGPGAEDLAEIEGMTVRDDINLSEWDEDLTKREWAKIAVSNGISRSTFQRRADDLGWSQEDAATIPLYVRRDSGHGFDGAVIDDMGRAPAWLEESGAAWGMVEDTARRVAATGTYCSCGTEHARQPFEMAAGIAFETPGRTSAERRAARLARLADRPELAAPVYPHPNPELCDVCTVAL